MSLARWPVPQSRNRPTPPSHIVTPPAAAVAPSNPDWYWPVITPRRPVGLRVRRARFSEPPWPSFTPPAFPPESPRPRVKQQLQRRARLFSPPLSDVNRCVPVYQRPRVKPQLQRRGRLSEVVPAQVTVPLFPPTLVRPRVKPALQRRAHLFEPPWSQGAQPGAPTLIERSKMGVGL